MSRFTMGFASALILLAVALAAGCGGSDSSSSDSTSTESASTDTTSTTTADGRLTKEQWATYQTSRQAFVKANAAAKAKVAACGNAQSASVLQKCVGNVFGELADATQALGTTLTGFGSTVSGSCADALGGFVNYVTPYAASANQIQASAASGSIVDYQSAASDLSTTADAAKGQVTAFEKDCAPA